EPFAEIARKLNCSVRVVQLFERLFFNVRDRLECRSWIEHVAIGNRDNQSQQAKMQRLMKQFAYFGGVPGLEFFLYRGMNHLQRPGHPSAVDAFFTGATHLGILLRSVVAMHLAESDGSKSDLRLIRMFARQQMAGKRRQPKEEPAASSACAAHAD